jgi:hypothetical protein
VSFSFSNLFLVIVLIRQDQEEHFPSFAEELPFLALGAAKSERGTDLHNGDRSAKGVRHVVPRPGVKNPVSIQELGFHGAAPLGQEPLFAAIRRPWGQMFRIKARLR